ncbi:MAG: transcription antitermination factor NusB [Verrucomicrobia bacterium]|nr:MAG: transcription antitermination factor NusB [Verrucomicrobiota bacterium]
MRKRREAREKAVQFLFQHDMNPPEDLGLAFEQFWHNSRLNVFLDGRGPTWGEKVELPPASEEDTATRQFAEGLVRGVLENRDRIDGILVKQAHNWDMHRMAVVDRNIMRLAIYEMLCRDDIPPVVSINEAVDIAKKFSTAESGKFVNGILDKVKDAILRPARTAKDAPAP